MRPNARSLSWREILREVLPRQPEIVCIKMCIRDRANIGTMDQTAWNLGHLQMLKGHLPENEQEIAMESGMLTALGYQGTPGEKITLNIVTTTAYQNDMVVKAYTSTLCGVIKDCLLYTSVR